MIGTILLVTLLLVIIAIVMVGIVREDTIAIDSYTDGYNDALTDISGFIDSIEQEGVDAIGIITLRSLIYENFKSEDYL